MTTKEMLIKELDKLPTGSQIVLGKKGDNFGRYDEYDFLIERRSYGFDNNADGYYSICPTNLLSSGAIKR